MPNKYGLTIGINTYPGAPLQGCVNDATDWRSAFELRGYQTTSLLDGDATKANILGAIRENVSRLKFRDTFALQYSGHGSYVPDKNGDEVSGRDDVWCAYDYQNGGLVLDDELHSLLSDRAYGTKVLLFSDSCYSGSVNKFVEVVGNEKLSDQVVKEEAVRFLPPAHFLEGQELAWAREAALMPVSSQFKRTPAALISGCSDNEYSYDAWVGNRYNGAFTHFALQTLVTNPKSLKEWYGRIRMYLPRKADWNQTPQLGATWWQQNRWML